MGGIKFHNFILAFLVATGITAFGQKSLQLTFTRFGALKKYEVFVNQTLEYKLKGEHHYRTGRIANLQDSLVIFAGESSITLSSIKRLRIRRNKYHLKLFRTIFLIGGVGYPLLATVNHAIIEGSPAPDKQTAIVSASFFAAGLLMHELNIRRIRITPNKSLKIVHIDYEKLNQAEPATGNDK